MSFLSVKQLYCTTVPFDSVSKSVFWGTSLLFIKQRLYEDERSEAKRSYSCSNISIKKKRVVSEDRCLKWSLFLLVWFCSLISNAGKRNSGCKSHLHPCSSIKFFCHVKKKLKQNKSIFKTVLLINKIPLSRVSIRGLTRQRLNIFVLNSTVKYGGLNILLWGTFFQLEQGGKVWMVPNNCQTFHAYATKEQMSGKAY